MRICPVNEAWLHNYILEPHLEGAARINIAWQGIDWSDVNEPTLSLKNRIVLWLKGVSLLLPIFNITIWIFWRTFGNPTRYSDPYSPDCVT